MSYLLFLIFIGWSITNIIVNGDIFDFLRHPNLGIIARLFSCITCTGFWVGIIESILVINLANFESPLLFNFIYVDIFFHGVFISGSSVVINSFLIYLVKK
jgi:hypothetical protein